MTREQVIKLFPDATDDQITALLNQNNSEVAREKEKASGYKEKASKADELQKKLTSLNPGIFPRLKKQIKPWKKRISRLLFCRKTMQSEIRENLL